MWRRVKNFHIFFQPATEQQCFAAAFLNAPISVIRASITGQAGRSKEAMAILGDACCATGHEKPYSRKEDYLRSRVLRRVDNSITVIQHCTHRADSLLVTNENRNMHCEASKHACEYDTEVVGGYSRLIADQVDHTQ